MAIRTSEILTDDNLDALIAKLKQLEGVVEALTGALKKQEVEAFELEGTTKKLNATTANGREEITKNAKQAEVLDRTYKQLKQAEESQNAALLEMREQLKQANRLRQLEAKLNTTSKDSYDNLSAQLSILKIRYKQLTIEEQKNTTEGQKLTKRIKEINDTLKEMDANVGVHTRNVGNYRDAIADLPGVFGAAGRGVQGLSTNLKALLKNPIVLFVGLISAGLVALFQAFQRSEKGAQFMAKATGFLNASMSILVKIVDNAITAITSFANDPLTGIKNLGESIVENIINRLKGVVISAGLAGKALWELLTGNLDAAKESAKALDIAMRQVVTGLDPRQQREFADAIKEVTEGIAAQAAAFTSLETAKRDTIKTNRELVKSAEQLQTIEELNRATADDMTKSFAEREAAAEKARMALEARSSKEIQIAKSNLSLLNREIDLRKSNGENVEMLLDQQLSAYQDVIRAERQLTLSIRDNEKQRDELKQDRLERDLDILIDGFDNQKTVNERILRDERKTMAERAAIYEETVRLANDSFQKQIETIQKFTGIQVDANELIGESDAVLLNQKIRSLGLSEIIEGRLLEIVRERRLAVQDLSDAEKALLEERNKGNTAKAIDLFDFGKAAEKEALKRVEEIASKAAKTAQYKLQEESEKSEFSIYSMLGINDPKQQSALTSALQTVKGFLNEYVQAMQKAADERVRASERSVSAAENEYNRQVALLAAGETNTADTAQRELARAKANQDKALEQQRKAQKTAQAIQTIEQVSSLTTATANLWKSFSGTGPVSTALALGAIALMWGSFAATKIRASQLSKQEFSEGDYTVLQGGAHGSGRDIFVGEQNGKKQFAEGGEARMILSKRSTRKYQSLLPEIFQSLKHGTFENEFARQASAAKELPLILNVGGNPNVNMSGVETGIGRLIEQGKDRTYTDSKGRLVVKRGNRTTTYVN